MSGTDLSQLSDQILNGNSDIQKLPIDVRGQLVQYWKGLGVNFDNPDVAKSQLTDLTGLNRAQQNQNFFQSNPFGEALNYAFKPISLLGSAGHWLYSQTASPAISFTALAAHSAIYGYDGSVGGLQDMGDLWDKAHYISPGQSVWELGLNNADLKQRGITPAQMELDKKAQAKGQIMGPQTAENPWGTKSQADLYFGSGWAQNTTGSLDIASSWYLDPLSKAGKIAGLAKAAALTKPVAEDTKFLGMTVSKGIKSKAIAAAPEGATPEQVGQAMAQQNSVQQVVNRIMQIKQSSQGTGATIFNLRTGIGTLKNSSAGDALASLLASAKDQDEVSRIMRIGMGDSTALGNTLARNDELAANISSMNLSISQTDQGIEHLRAAGFTPTSPQLAQALAVRQRYSDLLSKYTTEQNLIGQQRDALGAVENLHYNQTMTSAALAARSAANTVTSATANALNGMHATFLVNSGNFVVKMLRTAADIKPSSWIDVNDPTSWREVDASLKEVKGMTDEQRKANVGAYIAANANQRGGILIGLERSAVKSMVDRYNVGKAPEDQIDPAIADQLHEDYIQRRTAQVNSVTAARQNFSTGTVTDANGVQTPADVFGFSNTGEALTASPVLETQLLNTHQMMDFKSMQQAINIHGSNWSNAMLKAHSLAGTTVSVADTMNHWWKALQLLRPAYMPRAMTDDFLGQVARFGALSMAQRAINGGKIMARDYWLSTGRKSEIETSRVNFALTQQHLEELGRQEQQQITKVQGLTPGTPEHDLESANLEQLQDHIQNQREKAYGLSQIMAGEAGNVGFKGIAQTGVGTRQVQIGRDIFSAPYGGPGGAMARDNIAGTRFAEMVNSDPANFYLRQLRQLGWQVTTVKADGELKHMLDWNRALKDQVAQSYPGRLALQNKTADQIAERLKHDPQGQQFMRDMGLQHVGEQERAEKIVAHVNSLLPPSIPETAPIRAALLDGTYNMNMLKTVQKDARPPVSGELWDYATGKSKAAQLIDNGISGFYKWLGDVPSTRLLRNPLFKQEYQAHLARQLDIRQSQGIDTITQDERALMEAQARKRAMIQVKRYTYNMDHETKMQYAMRNMLAFLGPTAESWMRWGRIINDKPETLGKIANAYNAPSRAGITTDGSGNKVDGDGYAMVNGVRTFIPIAARNMTIQVPDWLGGKALAKHLGIEDASFKIPMSSAMMVMTEGDGPMPVGVGPIVGIPLNHFAQSNPGLADWAQTAGLLPYGPQPDAATVLPGWVKKTADAWDSSTQSRQNALGYLMQAETMKYHAGLRKTAPTWDELQQKADRWAVARSIWSAIGPVSSDQADPYQFFRDDYKRMQQLDPKTADEKFLEKYGDSFFDFSESMSKNNSGLAPTQDAVRLSQQWQKLINDAGGQYAGLIVGDEANSGTYSNGAYYYEKNTPMAAGSTTTMRSGLSAREAWTQANANRGWAEYDKVLGQLNAQLIQRGLKSYSDPGANDLNETRKRALGLLINKYTEDGSVSKFYNPDFAAAYGNLNTDKYNQNANDLAKIVTDPRMWAKAFDAKNNKVGIRSDIYTLRAYLEARDGVTQELRKRQGAGGSGDINANSNADLRVGFETLTNSLIEQDTKFQAIHTRYFANDMGYNTATSPVIKQQLALQAQGQTASMAGQPAVLNIGQTGDLGV